MIDGKTVITGSFNFTNAAEDRNAENLLIIEGKPEIAQAFLANFHAHEAHSRAYQPPSPDPAPQTQTNDDVENITVYATRTGEKYHRQTCRHAQKSGRPMSLADAKRKGLTPCKVCSP